jgi:predicted metal-dependent hydrolase
MPAAATTRYEDPLFQIDWAAVDRDCWWLPPDALSLSGVTEFEALPIATRRTLSHCEYLHLLQTGLWLEALFVERLAVLADRSPDLDRRAAYLREIREEAGHSLMFVELIRRSGIAMPPARSVRMRFGRALGRRLIPAGSALFWALVVVGEEVPNRLNRRLARGVEHATLSTVVYRMATLHSRDEANHAALARAHCERETARLPSWQRALLSPLLAVTIALLVRHVHYPPSWVYESAGLLPAGRWRARARQNSIRAGLARETLLPTRTFLQQAGWRV